MTGTFATDEAVELAVVTRDGFVESRHCGSAVVLSADGEVLAEYGNPRALVYPRSALKPFISVSVMSSGVTLRGEDAAISTASHTGTPFHVAAVRRLLHRVGLDEHSLRCPAQLPLDSDAMRSLLQQGGDAAPVYHGCSGKHAGLLVACRTHGWSTDDYLDADHPVQKLVRETIERLSGERPAAATADGCGTPLYAMSLTGLARGIQRIAQSSEDSPFGLFREAAALAQAARENPTLICGPGEPDSVAIERLGVFAKLGFEGIQTMVAPNGVAVALKTLDGSLRPGVPVALTLLAKHGGLDPATVADAIDVISPRFYAGRREVGRLIPTVTDL